MDCFRDRIQTVQAKIEPIIVCPILCNTYTHTQTHTGRHTPHTPITADIWLAYNTNKNNTIHVLGAVWYIRASQLTAHHIRHSNHEDARNVPNRAWLPVGGPTSACRLFGDCHKTHTGVCWFLFLFGWYSRIGVRCTVRPASCVSIPQGMLGEWRFVGLRRILREIMSILFRFS